MKTFLKRILIAAGLTLGANALLAASTGNDWTEQYFKAKVGRNTPAEEARQRDAQANVAFREDAGFVAAPNWIEQHFKAKVGRYSRGEEARLRELEASTAFREEPLTGFVAPTWAEQLFNAKLGRDVPGK
jgi:hypothetical protein